MRWCLLNWTSRIWLIRLMHCVCSCYTRLTIESKVARLNLGFFGESVTAIQIPAVTLDVVTQVKAVILTSATSKSSPLSSTSAIYTDANVGIKALASTEATSTPTPTPATRPPIFVISSSTSTQDFVPVPTGAIALNSTIAIIPTNPKSSKIAIIAGSSAGGVVLVSIIIAFFVLRRRRAVYDISCRGDTYGPVTRKTSKSGKVYQIRQLNKINEVPEKEHTFGAKFFSGFSEASYYSTDVDLPIKLGSPVQERPTLIQSQRYQSMMAHPSRFSGSTGIASSGVGSYDNSEDKIISEYMDVKRSVLDTDNDPDHRVSKLWKRLFR